MNFSFKAFWYEIVYLFMNLSGYKLFNNGLAPVDSRILESNKYCDEAYQLQVYEYAVSLIKGQGSERVKLLEIGCGSAHGLGYIRDFYKSFDLMGVDRSYTACCFGRRSGLDLKQGVGENLPYGDAFFDVVLMVETLHAIPNWTSLFNEVQRCLKLHGNLVIIDFSAAGFKALQERFEREAEKSGFQVQLIEDLTTRCIAAMERDCQRKQRIFDSLPFFIKPFIQEALSLPGSKRYDDWVKNQRCYYAVKLIKQ